MKTIKKFVFIFLLGILSFLVMNILKLSNVSATNNDSILLGDIPYLTWYYEYQAIQKDGFSIQAKAGWFDETKADEDFSLVLFDTKESDNRISCQAKEGLGFENYRYDFNNNSIVFEIKAIVGGTLTVDYSSCTNLVGWFDWNAAYIVRKLENDGTLTPLTYHKNSDDGSNVKADLVSKTDYTLLAGETLFIEYGATAGRNFQNLYDAKISFDKSASLTDTYSLCSVVEDITANNYQTINKDLFNVSVKAGWFDGSDATNKSLVNFDGTYEGALTCSAKENLSIANVHYAFSNNSVVYVIEAKEAGKLTIDYSNCTIGGWLDWNVGYIVRKEETDGKVSEISFNYHISEDTENAIKSAITNTPIIDLGVGEKVYIEFGAGNEATGNDRRCFEGIQNAVINFTTKECSTAVNTLYKDKVNTLFNSKVESDYSPANYSKMLGYKNDFNDTNFTSIETIVNKYNETINAINGVWTIEESLSQVEPYKTKVKNDLETYVNDLKENNHYTQANLTSLNSIYNDNKDNFDFLTSVDEIDTEFARIKGLLDAVSIDTLFAERKNAIDVINNLFASLVEENYDLTSYNNVKNSVDAFVLNIESYETVDDLNASKDEVIKAINDLKPTNIVLEYTSIPQAVKDQEYGYVDLGLFSYTIKTGNVKDGLESFDSMAYDDELACDVLTLGRTGVKVGAWKWVIMPKSGVVLVYKANANIKLTITDSRIANATGRNGWSDDCVLSYYIVRGDEVKTIKQIAKPTTDADYSGSFYLKSGDILYVEFNTSIANAARNTESPNDTIASAVEEFDEEAYIAQNHDLPTEVKQAITNKIEEINAYLNNLNKDDYSLANYANLEQYVTDFIENIESKVNEIEDVNKEYNDTIALMDKVLTKSEEALELRNHINNVIEELKNVYETLLKSNDYTDENKQKLEQIYNDAKTTIESAQSKVTANSAKIKAVQQLNAVTATKKASGCSSSIGLSLVSFISLLGIVLFIKRKKQII